MADEDVTLVEQVAAVLWRVTFDNQQSPIDGLSTEGEPWERADPEDREQCRGVAAQLLDSLTPLTDAAYGQGAREQGHWTRVAEAERDDARRDAEVLRGCLTKMLDGWRPSKHVLRRNRDGEMEPVWTWGKGMEDSFDLSLPEQAVTARLLPAAPRRPAMGDGPSAQMRSVMRGVCEDVRDGLVFEEASDPGEVIALARQLADQYLRLLDDYEQRPNASTEPT